MKLFAVLNSVRQAEREHFPFVKSLIDFDIIIEVGIAEEEGRPLSLKQLFLLGISSRTTVRRRLDKLHEQGILLRQRDGSDGRSTRLLIPPATLARFNKYGSLVSAFWREQALADALSGAR